ncbi:MAG: energy-coupling factor transporter transmembrane component T [Anaerolineae bacterium]|jgi:energy-coupling factor transport system permease protein|nr:energy-coupling factor transporter transmembrane component T [Anaerolineae bacterium]
MLTTWRYRERKSLVQTFDPRAWIIFIAMFIFSAFLFWDMRYLAVFFGIALFFVLTSGVSWKESKRAWLFIGGFITFFAVLTMLTGRGGMEFYETDTLLYEAKAKFDVFGWVPTLRITAEKTSYAISMLLRVLSIAAVTILIPYTLNPALYGITFHGLGLPDKFAFAMDLTMRFVPSFARDFQLTMDAQKARGYELEKLEGGIVQQIRKLAPLVVPVTISAVANSEDIIDAMDLRAFGVKPRTWLQQLEYRKRDYILMGLGGAILFGSIVLAMFGFGQYWTAGFLL